MFWNRFPKQAAMAWQATADRAVEAGQTPLLNLGASDTVVDGLPGLSVLADVRPWPLHGEPPLAVAGGNSPLWLAAFLRAGDWRDPDSSVLSAVFGGADAATQMASLNLLDGAQRFALTRAPVRIPTGFWPYMAPHSQPAATAPWDALPMAAAGAAHADAAHAGAAHAGAVHAGAAHARAAQNRVTADGDVQDQQDGLQPEGWVVAATLGLSLVLVLLALFL